MKNSILNTFTTIKEVVCAKTLLTLLSVMMMGNMAYADIIDLNASADGGFLANGTTNVVFDVSFNSNTLENADYIEFILPNGASSSFSLAHGTPSPSPYASCGDNLGNQMTGAGVGWGRPSYQAGGSLCGAFNSGTTHKFGVSITQTAGSATTLNITVRIVGDGFGESSPTIASSIVQLQSVACDVDCPADITVYANQGDCEAFVNIPLPTLNGNCPGTPFDRSGYYSIGTHEVELSSFDGSATCIVIVTVVDDTDPYISNCNNRVYNLADGECFVTVPDDLVAIDDCTFTSASLTQSENFESITSSVGCDAGNTSYFRIFNTADHAINTYLNIEEVELGIYSSFNFPIITVNLYKYTGILNVSSMELVSSVQAVVPNLNQDYLTVPISATFEAGEQFAIEINVPGSNFSGFVMGANFDGETAPSYISSLICGYSTPVTIQSQGYNDDLLIRINGTESSTKIDQIGGTYSLGDDFPIGNFNLTYLVTDAYGNTSQCAFTVSINNGPNPIGSIGCNDLVNISLDEDCIAVVTADQVLEGGPYGCYDNYTVTITDAQGNNLGNTVTASEIGMTLNVTVTGPNGNSCWGQLLIEDKYPVELECLDVYTSCSGDLIPGSPLGSMLAFPANIVDGIISPAAPASKTFYIDVFGLNKSTLTDINVEFGIDHTNASELLATLKGPNGATIILFNGPGTGCAGDNMMITLDDEAFQTAADLNTFCDVTDPAIYGRFKPMNSLSTFDGIDPNGTWEVTISDNYAGNGGEINSVKIVLMQSGGTVTFPTSNDVTYTQESESIFTVYGIDACGPATLSYSDDIVEESCSSIYSKVIARTWLAQDVQGNISESCVQTIYVYRNGLATLTWPTNYDGIQATHLKCDFYGDNVPGPGITGYPTGDLCDNVQIFPHEDTRIDVCPKSYKIIRKWKVLEWCSGEVREHNQIIKVVDDEGPQMTCPSDMTLSADSENCSTTVVVPRPTITKECSDNVTYELYYLPAPDGGPIDQNAFFIKDNVLNNSAIYEVGFGETWIKWIVTDECGNSNECFFTVTIVDNVPPSAVCDQFTKVSIGSDGKAKVFASTFDDGSTDNCNIARWEVRKMVDVCNTGSLQFNDHAFFCCEEVGTSVMVEFRVFDEAGNSNSCMVEVAVEDKLPPYITDCPDDISLDCQSDYKDTSVTGVPVAIDNCEVVSVTYVDSGDIDNCGRGIITRTWTAVDKEGLKNSCIQKITLTDLDPFDQSDIQWPLDYKATTCGTNLDPENLPSPYNYPQINDDICALTAATYTDQVFNFVDGSCEKILRTWTIIDWCTYNANNPTLGQGYFQHLQIIKLENTIAPTILTDCSNKTVPSYGNCGGDIQLELVAEDDCTAVQDLNYSWSVDVNNDGVFEPGYSGNTHIMSRYYEDGTHKITWRVEDKCGNVSTCAYLFTVKDGKKPTPYCLSSVTTVVMNNNGMIEIWANDFDLDSYDNCTPQDELRFSFSSNVNQTSRTFTCADIPDGQSMQVPLEMWVTDNAGNQDYCSINIILQDNLGNACPDQLGGLVFSSGRVSSPTNLPLEDVSVYIDTDLPEFPKLDVSDDTGSYLFSNLQTAHDYTVNGSNNADPLNGVSTLDIVLIQRHILGLATLDSPYKIIASDVNNDSKVTASDLVKLRKLILGITSDFDNGQESWRFVTKINGYNDATHPFPFRENYQFDNMTNNQANKDFVGVKIGDVNLSAVYNARSGSSENRGAGNMIVQVPQLFGTAGTQIKVPVYVHEIENFNGYQFTMNFDASSMTLATIESNVNSINESNFGLHKAEDGIITTSWNGDLANADSELFTLVFDMKKDANVFDKLSISSDITPAEAYDGGMNVYGVSFTTRSESGNELAAFEIFQNKPNPFNSQTSISYYAPNSGPITMKVFDINGRLIYNVAQEVEKGYGEFILNATDLNATGVLYYQIEFEDKKLSKKMISLE